MRTTWALRIVNACAALYETMGFKDITWTQVGGVISSHCGPTAFGAVLTLKA